MFEEKNHTAATKIAANQRLDERDYWVNKLSGDIVKSSFPYDSKKRAGDYKKDSIQFEFSKELFSKLIRLSNGSDPRLHMVFVAVLTILLNKYTGNKEIIVGMPIYKPDIDIDSEGEFINTVLALKNPVRQDMTFKELLLQVRRTIIEADKNQNYPFDILLEHLGMTHSKEENPLFDTIILLENIHDIHFIRHVKANMIFSLARTDEGLKVGIEYNSHLYYKRTIEQIYNRFVFIIEQFFLNLDIKIFEIEVISETEKNQLLFDFNDTEALYPTGKTISRLIEDQVEKTPHNIAITFKEKHLTYEPLNETSNRLARVLRKSGVVPESIVGIMMEPGLDMVVGLIAILKAGGVYLPIDAHLPLERVLYMLEDSDAKFLLSNSKHIKEFSFTIFQNLESIQDIEIILTKPREYIKDFDRLPIPDRSLIDLRRYKNKIGMASAVNCISLQTSRGCPYKCLFCHKVWSKNHVYRSAENIYSEVEYFYKKGVTNFAIIDDCFNLNRENSMRFFRLVIKNKLNLQLFFPNGLRGDILTPDYIDLMVEAGTRGINLSLETASPRLQKLLKKYLNIEKFKEVMDYISTRYPGVILEIATMHGFPTETEEEAMKTLNFIKDIKWLHFPYIHILKIYPNTEMEELALRAGVLKEDILKSKDLAYNEIPDTLPFPKSFTRKYQADFLNNYFLLKERLKQVLPVQLDILSEAALVKKYNTYLPAEINTIKDIMELAGIPVLADIEPQSRQSLENENTLSVFDTAPRVREPSAAARNVLFLDLSTHFSSTRMLYHVSEQPIGLISLLTWLKDQFKDKIDGRIYKSGEDFDSFEELRTLVEAYKPELIGIRSLTFYKEFFHETVSLLRQWGVTVPIIAGGPYATSDYDTILRDKHINLVVLGEGEYTMAQLIEKMLDNNFLFPSEEILKNIKGIAYAKKRGLTDRTREIILYDRIESTLCREEPGNLEASLSDGTLAYVMYTSGSTGRPKGVMVEHRQVNNCISWMQEKFNIDERDVIVNRTDLTFDPSVWEIFWPLYRGGKVNVLDDFQRKDAGYLIRLMADNHDLTMMYCPATLLNVMTYILNSEPGTFKLKLPWLIIGAEPVSKKTIMNFYTYFEGKIVNTYGPTECTINNTWYEIAADDDRSIVPIGKPIANNQVYILSEDIKPMPKKNAGEIFIAGKSTTRGYLNKPAKTHQQFIDNPFGPGKMYKTGDIGRWLEDGNIEIMGRMDEQIKLRGFRIEPGEIETVLAGHPSINECVVIVKNDRDLQEEVSICKNCGITTKYPGVHLNDDGNCEICENLSTYKRMAAAYFKTPEDLKQTIIEANRGKEIKYDCLLLYSGGRGSAYALYTLVKMGFNVLTVTYDHGYFGKWDLRNIKEITSKLGVDNVVLTHRNSKSILKESIKTAHTVCRGCFHTSASLAGKYALKNHINIIIGATLSRGQIIENKLFMFFMQGISEPGELETEIAKIQRSAPDIDKNIFEYIDIDKVADRTLYDKLKFIDFYRYCDVTNEEIIDFLNNKDPYWKKSKSYAIYSTNCPIKQLGDYGHLKTIGYHYYGSATSWEKRLGHITLENVKEDLTCRASQKGYETFLTRLGIKEEAANETDSRDLCAYIVPGKDVDISELREYLSGKLPAYMIPSSFVRVERMPLTPVGKVDKRRLLRLGDKIGGGVEYEQPGNENETILAKVWEEVLGVNKIGVNDNFFQVGGDSIKAIQVSSQLRRYGLKVEIRDLFSNPTIKKLAECVTRKETSADQIAVEGKIGLTPTQQWFFESHFSEPFHFNQSIMLYKEYGFNEIFLEKIFTKLVEHHDALRMIYKKEGNTVIQENRGLNDRLFDMQVLDLKGKKNIREYIEKRANRIQREIDLFTGPLMKVGLFKTDTGDHLLIVIHHLVVDGMSWRILLEDFTTGYRQSENGEDILLPEKTDSFKHWSEKLREYSESKEALKELEYWKGIEEIKVKSLLTDTGAKKVNKKRIYTDTIRFDLGKNETTDLLNLVNRAYGTNINDILLCALGMAIQDWKGLNKVLINLEGHGREDIIEGIDTSRTVGWFTTMYPVVLDMNQSKDISYLIKSVKETLRQIPKRGIGYGILRYLTSEERREGYGFEIEPEINFNYLGEFGQEKGLEFTRISDLSTGENISPESEFKYALDINAVVMGGRFSLSFTYGVT